jgi:hypothetical protein
MRATAIVVLLLVGAFLAVALPIYNDHRIQDVTRVGLQLGTRVADRALAAHPGEWREVTDGGSLLPDNEKALPEHIARIQVMKDGLVRVTFKSPGELAEKAIEIRTTGKNGKFMRECRGDRIGEKFLPPTCRPEHGSFAIEGPPAPPTAFVPNKGWYISHPQKKTVLVDGLEVFVVPRGANEYDAWGGSELAVTDAGILKGRQVRAVEGVSTCRVASAEYVNVVAGVLHAVVKCADQK